MSNAVKTAGLLGLLSALFLLVGSLFGGTQGMVVAFGFAVVFNFAVYFFSDKMALAASRAKPIQPGTLPRVEAIMGRLTQIENMPMPRLYVIDSPQPNAFATGRSPRHAAVAVTRGILDILDDRELEGVLAHELAHVKNRDILVASIAATIAAALTMLTRMAFWGGMGRRNDNNPLGAILALVSIIVAPLVAMLIQMGISRAREFQADRSGAKTTGSPLSLASALQKLEAGTSRVPMEVNPAVSQLFIADPLKAFNRKGAARGMMNMFASHPPIPERIKRLQDMTMGIR